MLQCHLSKCKVNIIDRCCCVSERQWRHLANSCWTMTVLLSTQARPPPVHAMLWQAAAVLWSPAGRYTSFIASDLVSLSLSMSPHNLVIKETMYDKLKWLLNSVQPFHCSTDGGIPCISVIMIASTLLLLLHYYCCCCCLCVQLYICCFWVCSESTECNY